MPSYLQFFSSKHTPQNITRFRESDTTAPPPTPHLHHYHHNPHQRHISSHGRRLHRRDNQPRTPLTHRARRTPTPHHHRHRPQRWRHRPSRTANAPRQFGWGNVLVDAKKLILSGHQDVGNSIVAALVGVKEYEISERNQAICELFWKSTSLPRPPNTSWSAWGCKEIGGEYPPI